MDIYACITCMTVQNYTWYLLNEVHARLKVETKVDEIPFDALLAVLLLLQYKHVVVEELLQLLVGQIDTQLLK